MQKIIQIYPFTKVVA